MHFSDKVTRAKNVARANKPRGQTSTKTQKPSEAKKSKYFRKALKEEPEDVSEESSMSLHESAVPKINDYEMKEEKKENDHGSEESDEDEEWEEVEGEFVYFCKSLIKNECHCFFV